MPDSKFFSKVGPFTLEVIAEQINAELKNAIPNTQISELNTMQSAKRGDLTFLINSKYNKYLFTTSASACIIDASNSALAPTNLALLIHPNPHEAYAIVANLFYPDTKQESAFISSKASISKKAQIGKNVNISDFVVVGEKAIIGDNCTIGANTYIGDNVSIGNGTQVASNCSIIHSKIGSNCFIHPGACIGQDGFGFAKTSKGMMKVKQLGSVIIGNDVEIGANTCIDKGALEDTIINDGTKIDNLVQIGHNSVIGRSCVICGQVGLAGTTHIEDFVMLGGQAGIAGHLKIGSGSMVAAQSGVMADVAPKSVVGGCPSVPIRDWHKGNAIIRKLTKQKLGKSERRK